MTCLPLGDLVYRTPRGRLVHWARRTTTYRLATCCTGWPVADTALDPVSVRMEDRCNAAGCRTAWTEWLRRTIRDAQVDEIQRLRGAA